MHPGYGHKNLTTRSCGCGSVGVVQPISHLISSRLSSQLNIIGKGSKEKERRAWGQKRGGPGVEGEEGLG